MSKRDPHDILGVPRGASQAAIKAAWRKLAREHHPDVAGADAAAARAANRRMAEINRAYDQLRIGAAEAAGRTGPDAASSRRTTWPPRPRPTRPVTARLDLSGTFRPRNVTTARGATLPGQAPLRAERFDREPPRASQPNGPLDRGWDPNFRPAPLPSLDAASTTRIEFGKFHGHTLGEIAAFEPSYIDWLARTISHDPELVGAARALKVELDRRGVVRRPRPVPSR